jgi:hypothetical protein
LTFKRLFVDDFPEDVVKFKFLPQLVSALDIQAVGCIVLGPILKIGKKLNEEGILVIYVFVAL